MSCLWPLRAGISGYEFGIDVDTRIILVSKTLYPLGSAFDLATNFEEVSAGIAGPCLPAAGPTVLADFQALLLSTDTNIPICLRGTTGTCLPDSTDPAYIECDACIWRYFGRAYLGCAQLNGIGPIATQQTTWTNIKGLFE